MKRKGNEIAAEAWRADLLKRVRSGQQLGPAMKDLNRSMSAYLKAREHHRDWAAQISQAISDARREGLCRRIDDEDVKKLSQTQWNARFLDMRDNTAQIRIADALENTRPGTFTMVNVFPEVGKTTAVLNWVTRKICEDPNHRMALVSAGQDLTRDFVDRLERRLTDTSQFAPLIERYGPFKAEGRTGKPWAADRFTVAKSNHDEADPTVQALGWKSLAYGRRIDTLVIDDVQSVTTLTQTSEIYRALRSTYFSRGKQMRIFVVGTRVGMGDIYERMYDDDIVTKGQYIVMPCSNAEGDPTVPESWDLRAWGNDSTPRQNMEAKRKLVGEDAWFANYEQNPAADAISTFSAFLTGCLDNDRVAGEIAA